MKILTLLSILAMLIACNNSSEESTTRDTISTQINTSPVTRDTASYERMQNTITDSTQY